MVTGEEILRIAAREIGTAESPMGSNRVKYNEWFYGHDVSGDKYPWCVCFVQWVYHRAGLDLPLHTASAGGLLRWYQRNQPECVTKEPIQGCLCIFDFPKTKYDTDHIGLFVSKTDTKMTTIDGNTKNGNESNGGYVQQRTRRFIDLVNLWYIIPRGLVLVDWDKAIAEMTDEQAYKLYSKAVNYMVDMPLPTSWNAAECWQKARKMTLTHGIAPMRPASLLECATMIERYDEAVMKK